MTAAFDAQVPSQLVDCVSSVGAHEWFFLGNPHTAAARWVRPYDGYLWELTCRNSDGGERSSWIWGTWVLARPGWPIQDHGGILVR